MTSHASLLLIAYSCFAAVALYAAWRVRAWLMWRARRAEVDEHERGGG